LDNHMNALLHLGSYETHAELSHKSGRIISPL